MRRALEVALAFAAIVGIALALAMVGMDQAAAVVALGGGFFLGATRWASR